MSFQYLWRVNDIAGGEWPLLLGTGVMASIIAGRFSAGDSIEHLADDYDLPIEAVIDAIRLSVASTYGARGVYAKNARRMREMVPLTLRSKGTAVSKDAGRGKGRRVRTRVNMTPKKD